VVDEGREAEAVEEAGQPAVEVRDDGDAASARAQARKRLGGSGGGRPDIAEAGGKNVNLLDSVLNEVLAIVSGMLE